ncbi:MAG: SUMF1/EgtB/PvdO family nonheme iron enzyme [Alphaproteobacteria bacterium]|nr:SUMF1/EgtB/PvdO family nonheme iron enzyme [Alphaproteobacteria bacterium]
MSSDDTTRTSVAAMTYHTLVAASLDDLDSLGDDASDGTATAQPESLVSDDPTEQAPGTVVPERIADRYVRRELLGRGGMGEVWRVWDCELHRTVALKVLHGAPSPRTWARFEEEARVAAQLQHPGIIPVHDLGRLDDARMWFTMKEVRGRTLAELIEEVHRDWRLGRERSWTFRRLLEGFLRVCETLAYAHARGVVHRDIKPTNIMFGDYGEVLVVDWGIAKVVGDDTTDEGVHTDREAQLTQVGVVSGTPNYMSPEQAQGRSSEVGPAADVYSLGATLYDLLTERPPRLGKNVRQLLFQVATGEPPIAPPSSHPSGAAIDDALDEIVLTALRVEESERYPTAAELADDLRLWLDGAKKRERAVALLQEADTLLRQASHDESRAAALSAEAKAQQASVDRAAPVEQKQPIWALEDQARDATRSAQDARTRAIQQLRASLTHYPDFADAHERLSDVFAERHQALEAEGKHDEARSVASDLAQHDTGKWAIYLKGTGAVTLITDVPAAVRLHRYVEQGRRLVPVFERDLGVAPLVEVPVEMGSYLLTLHAEGRPEVRYPIWIRRNEHWDGVPPEGGDPSVIRIPTSEDLEPDDIYVPAGWFWVGDDEFEATLPLARLWSDGFVVKRFPVTVGEYVAYLNALLDAGEAEQAMAAEPRITGEGPYFERGPDGRWLGIAPGIEGLEDWPRTPDMPVTLVDWHQASAYATWRSRISGHPWRLPMEREWVHAARGADQRMYPMGDHLEPTWSRMRFTPDNTGVIPVETMPIDVSPYGVRGLAGNTDDWVADAATLVQIGPRVSVQPSEGPRRVSCGGACAHGFISCRVTGRSAVMPSHRHPITGFRISRSLGETTRASRSS